jgi:hypothetical protein
MLETTKNQITWKKILAKGFVETINKSFFLFLDMGNTSMKQPVGVGL